MPPRPALLRAAFWLYFAILIAALLWPKLKIEGPVPRPDLVIHFVAFGLFSFLANLSTVCGPPNTRPTITRAFALAAAVGLAAEALQLIPILHRSFGWDDWLFDCIGAALGLIPATILALRCNR